MDTKTAAREVIESARSKLIELSHRIHAHPELGFEEERAAGWMCEAMTDAGFQVERGVSNLPTAFVARAGSGPLHIAICAEYDALRLSATRAATTLSLPRRRAPALL